MTNKELHDNPAALQQIADSLYSPVIGDILDGMGYFHQFLPPEIRPLVPGQNVVGWAMPVLTMDVYGEQAEPFGKLTHALDDLRPGEVYISTGAAFRSANWGEILTATAKKNGAAGAVIDGYHRDTPQVLEQQFPVFSRGPFGQDSGPRMKVAEFRTTIEIAGVTVDPGDLIFADIDGVVVIPAKVTAEVIGLAQEKASKEKAIRIAIEGGMSATDAFAKFGVL
jgi:regulator of RNase E activity RraA